MEPQRGAEIKYGVGKKGHLPQRIPFKLREGPEGHGRKIKKRWKDKQRHEWRKKSPGRLGGIELSEVVLGPTLVTQNKRLLVKNA